jgi:hypothetical protein
MSFNDTEWNRAMALFSTLYSAKIQDGGDKAEDSCRLK